MSKFKFEIGAISDVGLVKKTNQDNILVKVGEFNGSEFGLFVVCDGLGGLSHGEVASATLINSFRRWWNDSVENLVIEGSEEKIINGLKKVVNEANLELIDYSNTVKKRIGTTVSAMFVLNNKYYIVHVGDSRIYKVSGKITLLTEDHSFVANEVKHGRMSKEEARNSQNRNILLQCVGIKEGIDIFHAKGTVGQNDMFLLCSDGFYGKLEEEYIQKCLNEWKYSNTSKDVKGLLNDMLDEVKRRAETDNISAVVTVMRKVYVKEDLVTACL